MSYYEMWERFEQSMSYFNTRRINRIIHKYLYEVRANCLFAETFLTSNNAFQVDYYAHRRLRRHI